MELSDQSQQNFKSEISGTTRRQELMANKIKPDSGDSGKTKHSETMDLSSSTTASSVTSPYPLVSSYFEKSFECQGRLGKGGFGRVIQAKNKLDGQVYAIKTIRCRVEHVEIARREVKALAELKHLCIVRYFNAWLEESSVKELDELDSEMSDQCILQSGKLKELASSSSEESKSDSGIIDTNGETQDTSVGGVYGESSPTSHPSDTTSSSIQFKHSDSCDKDSNGFNESGSSEKEKSMEETDGLAAPMWLYIQTELCQSETLKDWLKANNNRDHRHCLSVFEQILWAVDYLHGKDLMHRDLKPSNIFFSLEKSTVKVGDFGLVKAITPENSTDTSEDGKHTSQVGTELYTSPEQIAKQAYSHKIDIFALGMIFFELFCPFYTEMERSEVMRKVKKGDIPNTFEEEMPLQAKMVRWLLSSDPVERPEASDVRNSELLKNIRLEVMQ